MRVHSLLNRAPTSAPAAVQAEIRTESLHGIASQLQMQADLGRLTTALNAVGVSWVAVKGPVLSEHWYASPAQRDYVDLDVVVDPAQFGTVLDLLEANGAALVDTNFGLAFRQGRAELSLILSGGSALDLHWHVLNSPYLRSQFSLSISDLLERRQSVGVGVLEVPTLDAADSLMHVCLHTVLSGGRKLCWYRDIHEIVNSGTVSWDDFVARARSARCAVLVAVALARAMRLTSAAVPDGVVEALRGRGRAWAATIAALDLVRPLGGIADTRLSGALVVQASRDGSARSMNALARSTRYDLWQPLKHEPHHPWRRWRRLVSESHPSPLSAPSNSLERSRYLDYVAAQAG